MITGNPPYHVKNFYQLMKMIDKDITLPQPYNTTISLKLQVLLSKLLIKNPVFRMGWNDFFNNDWLSDKILEHENNLIGISINESLPNLDLIKKNIAIPSQKFIPNYTNISQIQTTSTDIITNLHSIDTEIKHNHFNNELEFDLLFSSSSGSDSFHSMESSYNDNYDDRELIKKEENIKTQSMEMKEELKKAINTTDINIPKHIKSKNINIVNKNKKTQNKQYNPYKIKSSTELEKEYDIINEKDLSNPLSPKKFNLELNIDPSQSPIFKPRPIQYYNMNNIHNLDKNNKTPFKTFLHSSVNILKESYDYLSSHNKSI